MGGQKVYVVSFSTNAEEDLASSWAWRYTSSIVGVYNGYQEARESALKHAQTEVDDLNQDYANNGDDSQSCYKDGDHEILVYWSREDENPRTRIAIDESSLS